MQKRWYVHIWIRIKDWYLCVIATIRSRLYDQLQYNLFLPQNARLLIKSPTFYVISFVLSNLQTVDFKTGIFTPVDQSRQLF